MVLYIGKIHMLIRLKSIDYQNVGSGVRPNLVKVVVGFKGIRTTVN